MPHFNYGNRLARLQEKMNSSNLRALFLGGINKVDANAYYYSGDSTYPTFLLLTSSTSIVFSSKPREYFPQFNEYYPLNKFSKKLKEFIKENKVKKLGVDGRSEASSIASKQASKYKPVLFTKQLLSLRLIKEPAEIRLLNKAREITLKCIHKISSNPFNKTENQVIGESELLARKLGASLDAFPPIALSGKRTSLFHESTSNKKISRKEVVLLDIGAKYKFYCGDASTTIYEGKEEQIINAITAVKEAKKAAEKKARTGEKGRALAEAALKVLNECEFAKYSFKKIGLSIGHFIGLEVHDGKGLEETRLKKGMAFTIEPGIYFPNKFGVRFEDVVILE